MPGFGKTYWSEKASYFSLLFFMFCTKTPSKVCILALIGQYLRWSLCWRGIAVAKPWILPDRPETCLGEMAFQMNTTSSAMSWTWSLSTHTRVNQPNLCLQTFRQRRSRLGCNYHICHQRPAAHIHTCRFTVVQMWSVGQSICRFK